MYAIRFLAFVSLVCFATAEIIWSARASMPIKRSDFTANTVGDLIVVAGGCDSDQVCPETEFYCYCPSLTNQTHGYFPANNSWKSLPDMPRPRHRHAAAVVQNKLYVFGGRDLADNILTEVDVFDFTSNNWTTLLNTYNDGEATSDFTATVVGTKIYATGGYFQDYTASNKTGVFDTTQTSPKWNFDQVPEMSERRGDSCSATVGDKIIVVGGFSEENFCKPLDTVEIYDPVKNTWEAGAPIQVARGDSACVVVDGNFHLLGGESKNAEVNCSKFSNVLHDVEVYNKETNSWDFETNLHVNRFRFAAASWNNFYFVLGGQSGATDNSHPVLDTVTSFQVNQDTTTTGATTGSDSSDAVVPMVSAFWLFFVAMVALF